jgi:hypothetical protein
MQTTQSLSTATKRQPSVAGREKRAMKTPMRSIVMAAFGLASILVIVSPSAHAQSATNTNIVQPTVFQAAGPSAASIQSTVDAFRAALGEPNNLSNPGPLTIGRREINWDGGSPTIMETTPPVTPFIGFLNTRGAEFTTPGIGLSQATPAGLAVLFHNPTYATIFATFSPSRLFTPVGSRATSALFFVPGTNGAAAATVTGFGAVFTDVDRAGRKNNTEIDYFDVSGNRIFTSFVPASPGNGSLSFIGVTFTDARIASVRIRTDDAAGPNDTPGNDIVMMDDFIYGEPQPLQ